MTWQPVLIADNNRDCQSANQRAEPAQNALEAALVEGMRGAGVFVNQAATDLIAEIPATRGMLGNVVLRRNAPMAAHHHGNDSDNEEEAILQVEAETCNALTRASTFYPRAFNVANTFWGVPPTHESLGYLMAAFDPNGLDASRSPTPASGAETSEDGDGDDDNDAVASKPGAQSNSASAAAGSEADASECSLPAASTSSDNSAQAESSDDQASSVAAGEQQTEVTSPAPTPHTKAAMSAMQPPRAHHDTNLAPSQTVANSTDAEKLDSSAAVAAPTHYSLVEGGHHVSAGQSPQRTDTTHAPLSPPMSPAKRRHDGKLASVTGIKCPQDVSSSSCAQAARGQLCKRQPPDTAQHSSAAGAAACENKATRVLGVAHMIVPSKTVERWPAADMNGVTAWRFVHPKAERCALADAQWGLYAAHAAAEIGAFALISNSASGQEVSVASATQQHGEQAVYKAMHRFAFALYERGASCKDLPLVYNDRSNKRQGSVQQTRVRICHAAFGHEALMQRDKQNADFEAAAYLRFSIPGATQLVNDAVEETSSDAKSSASPTSKIQHSSSSLAMTSRALHSWDAEHLLAGAMKLNQQGLIVPFWTWSSAWNVRDLTRRCAGLRWQLLDGDISAHNFYQLAASVLQAPSLLERKHPPETHGESVTAICSAIAKTIGFDSGQASPCGCACCRRCNPKADK